ncbi:hypothetical protein J4477_04605 [Candidatus Pacearchaeota archaeon]|nr:hypothetical protein [Candidatus Pacearchaeota archaeon]
MVEGYCVKCKTKREIKNPEIVQNARGGFMARGTCSSCGTKMSAMMSKDNAEKAVKQGAKKSY